ncbi:hypothetical protein [Rossellomorea sp. y25]|uniref:hypothetical protein n=1 Tax=Rossellomorea sp. y25 TaxID=3118174 RepID=UPI0030E4ADF9
MVYPLYNISNQESFFLLSEINNLKQTIKKLKDGYLYAENEHLREEISHKNHELELAYEQIKVNDLHEIELLKDRNTLTEANEKVESELKNANQIIINNGAHIQTLESEKKELEQSLLKEKYKFNEVRKQLEEIQAERISLKESNNVLLREIDTLHSGLVERDRMIYSFENEIAIKDTHLQELNQALSQSEETKKDLFQELLTKAEKLEGLSVERDQLMLRFEESKQKLMESEKMKVDYFEKMIVTVQQQIEENEWWLTNQFADIDRSSKKQEEKMDSLESVMNDSFERVLSKKDNMLNELEKFDFQLSHIIQQMNTLYQTESSIFHGIDSLRTMIDSNKTQDLNKLVTTKKGVYRIEARESTPIISDKTR